VATIGHTKKLLTTYLRRLTNLSGNNRSIFLPRLIGDQMLDVQSLSQLNGEGAFSIIEALIGGKQKMICRVADARMEASNEASLKLKKLQRLDRFIFEERGAKDLHVGWPVVQGKFNDGTLVRCPLLFFPVALVEHNSNWVLIPRTEAGITFNKSFLLAYAFYNQVKPSELLLEETFEETDPDTTVFRTWLYQLLQKGELDIHFNPDNYRDELTPFVNLKREEFEEGLKNGELKLFPKALLGIFPQAGSNLVPDYLQLMEEESIQDLEQFFHERTREQHQPVTHNFLPLVKEERIYTVFPLDIWQENALKAAKLGYSLVVQGPPGTGKSQLICNLITDALASGKRVLVVCQKRVALDVVYQRLKAHQLGEYLALVHDFKSDRKAIYDKLTSQIEHVDDYKSKNLSLDSIQLERRFMHTSHRMDQLVEELDEFKKNLFDESECGASIKTLYLRSDPAQDTINLKQEFQHFKFDRLNEWLNTLHAYLHYAQKFKRDDYIWRERMSFAGFAAHDLQQILRVIKDVDQFYKELTRALQDKLGAQLDWSQCEALLEKEPLADNIRELLKNELVYSYFTGMTLEQDEETSSLWLSNVEKNLMNCFEGDGPEASTPSHLLGTLQKGLYRSMKARKSLIGLIRWELFSKDKFLIKRTLVSNGLTSNKQGFKTLERKLDSRLNLEHNLTKLREKSWLKDLPATLDKKDFFQWFADQHFALNAKLNFTELRGLKNFMDPVNYSLADFQHRLKELYRLLTPIHALKVQWANYLTGNQVENIAQMNAAEALIETLKKDFDALCDFDRMEERFTAEEKSIIQKLADHCQSWDEDELRPVFINSLCLAWIDHLEAKHPELRMVSSGKIQLLENELRDLHREKQNLGAEIVLMRAREKVVDELKFNRLNNRVTYRDLHHQVTKKKKIWPIRKLISEMEEEVFKLVPCWLASPESVSAIFPMKEIFDVVIFDEASQCFAEQGIPSLYRGKQMIIAGDSMQLRPGDFYQARWQEDDFDHPDAEVDSLLELTGRYLMNVQLKGHYRSKAPELIDFSNRHFYKGTLQFLPDRNALNRLEPAMQYEKLDGLWENNTNRQEADRVAELVLSLTRQNPDKEIGVVTFNAPQQSLIMDMVEETFRQAQLPLPESLFIKNIENVQGDEKDVIIFSIAYAPDKSGKVHAQFGSLNAAGGENRLNVAVSRAREKIIVVTSLWPDQLQVEHTLNDGPKLLKAYLHYVLDNAKGTSLEKTDAKRKNHGTAYLTEKVKTWMKERWPDYTVQEYRFPSLDLTIQKDQQFIGALFTDDNLYFQSLSAKADHALSLQLLEVKHWPFLRVYSRNAWQDTEKFYNEISKFITMQN
jgi:hypothetical protein